MASPGRNIHHGSFLGAAAAFTLRAPFKAKAVRFWAVGGVWGVKIDGEPGMLTDSYLSSTGIDAGVTINADGSVLVASGADVNTAGTRVYYELSE